MDEIFFNSMVAYYVIVLEYCLSLREYYSITKVKVIQY